MKKEELLSFLSDGPWRNDACLGYAYLAMKQVGLNEAEIRKVLDEMVQQFDLVSVEEAAAFNR